MSIFEILVLTLIAGWGIWGFKIALNPDKEPYYDYYSDPNEVPEGYANYWRDKENGDIE